MSGTLLKRQYQYFQCFFPLLSGYVPQFGLPVLLHCSELCSPLVDGWHSNSSCLSFYFNKAFCLRALSVVPAVWMFLQRTLSTLESFLSSLLNIWMAV